MKNIILIFIFILPIWAFGQDYRVIDWKTDVLNVQTVGVDTFKFDAEPKDYNDAGAITREIGNYFIDYVARCFKIIDSDATTITVVDLEHINLAPQSNKIGRVYQSIVDADSIFKSIGGVDISVLDDLSKWKDVARNNELFGRKIKELDRRDTTGIYHINRQLLDSISQEDTTNWNKYLIETDTSGILDKDNFFWSANKKYELITPHIGGGTGDNVYMTNVNSDISGYKKTSYTNDTGITSFSAIASADTVLVQQFLFDGQLSTSIIDAGGWIVRTYCNVSSIAGVSKFKYEFFVYDDADSTIFSFYSDEINNTAFQYNEYTSFQSAFNLGKSTYRLGVRVYFLTTLAAPITGTFRVGDGETSYINTPIAMRHVRIRNPNEDANVQHMTADDQNAINQYKKDSASYLTSEVDGSTTNEIQDLSRAGNTLSLSGDGTTVDLSDLVNPSLTGYRLKTDHDSLSNLDEKSYNSLTDKPDLTSYRQKSDHDSLSALDEKSYNSLTDKPTSLPASDVYPWAKAATKPTYTYSEVGLGNVDNTSDANKPISTATQTALNNLVPFSGADRDVDLGANSISTDTVKIDGTPLLLNTFKQGNLGGASNIFYSTGASSQPASGSVNQVVGGGLLNTNSVVKWDGSKFANTGIIENVGYFSINQSELRFNEDGNSIGRYGQQNATSNSRSNNVGYAGQQNATSNQNSNNVGNYGQYSATSNIQSNNVGYAGQYNATTNQYSNNVGNAGQYNATTNQNSNNVGYAGQQNATSNIQSNNVGYAGQQNATNNQQSNNVGYAGQQNATSNIQSNNVGYAGQQNATNNQQSNNLGSNGFRYSSTGLPVKSIIKGLSLGHNTRCFDTISTNEIVIGADAVGHGNNTATFGNMQITDNYFNGNLIADILKSRVTTGTPPLVVASSTKVDSLNVGLLDGKKASDFQLKSDTLTFDATLSDLADSSAAIRALANTKAVVSGTNNFIPKITGANTLGNSNLIDYGSYIYSNVQLGGPSLFSGTSLYGNGIIELGGGRTGNNHALIDFTGDSIYTDFGLRIVRGSTGPNTFSRLVHRGKGDFSIIAQDAGRLAFVTKNTTAVTIDTLQNTGFGTQTPAARIHSESLTEQLRLSYNYNNYARFVVGGGGGNLTIIPSGGLTKFSGGISATAYSTFSGQVEMTGADVNFGASTILRKNGSDIFTAPITMGACGSAGQVLTSTGINSAPTWTTPATGSGSGITSIGIQVPTGLTVSPASLTANGTFTLGLQSGYSIPTTSSQTNWNTAYSQRLTSVSASYPMYLSLTNNVLTGYLNNTLTNFGGVVPSVGYPYWNGSSFSYQAATTTYTLPTATDNVLGGVKVATDDGGLYMSGGFLLQKDNVLTTRTPEVSDYIAFYDNSATAQGKMTLSTLGSLIGGSGGSMVYPGAGIPVSTGSAWGTSKTAPSGAIVGTTDSQALTNKSINGVTLSTIEGPTRFLRGDGTYQRLNIVQTLTSASSITMNIWNGSKAVLALATNSTITITNVPDGGEGSIEVTSSGAYTLAIAGSTGYTTTQKMGTVSAIASSAHTTVFYWRSGKILYYGFLLNN